MTPRTIYVVSKELHDFPSGEVISSWPVRAFTSDVPAQHWIRSQTDPQDFRIDVCELEEGGM